MFMIDELMSGSSVEGKASFKKPQNLETLRLSTWVNLQHKSLSLKPSTSGLVAKYVAVNFVFLKPTNKHFTYV